MEKYVRVDWPESQRWMGEDGVFGAPFEDDWDRFCVFVPEELYNLLTEREEPAVPHESDPIWDEFVGMPEESKPWFMQKKLNNE